MTNATLDKAKAETTNPTNSNSSNNEFHAAFLKGEQYLKAGRTEQAYEQFITASQASHTLSLVRSAQLLVKNKELGSADDRTLVEARLTVMSSDNKGHVQELLGTRAEGKLVDNLAQQLQAARLAPKQPRAATSYQYAGECPAF